jgi:cysteine desulfurase
MILALRNQGQWQSTVSKLGFAGQFSSSQLERRTHPIPATPGGYNDPMTAPTTTIYLDHNATTPMLSQAAEAVAAVYGSVAANPASQHGAGRQARRILEGARDSVAAIMGARCDAPHADQIIFTSGGTEANNLAIFGLAGPSPAHMIVSAIEHPSVAAPAAHLRRLGWAVDTLPVSDAGIVQVELLPDLLRPNTRLVSIMLANNETGVLQPVARAAQLCADRGVLFHSDAVQAVGKIPVDFQQINAAAMTLSAHKFHGPPGIGALLVRHDTKIVPLVHGGFQQAGARPGTEPVALAAGLQVALEHWQAQRDAIGRRMTALRDEFEALLRAGWPDLVINGGTAERVPQTSNVSFPGLDRQALMMALDLAGVACSTGSACASGSSEPSATLVAMCCPRPILHSSLRFSLGQQTSQSDVHDAAGRILRICNELRSGKMGRKSPLCRSP